MISQFFISMMACFFIENSIKKEFINLKKIRELDQAKTQFFANISHELRTPLTLILGPLESIISGDYGENFDRNDEKFKSMLGNGSRLLKLINNLLDISKIEAGRMSVKKRKTEMAELLQLYVSTVKSGAESRGLHVVFNDNSDGVIAYVDRDLIEKAVFNLISNALKFTPEGGNVIVQLDKAENEFSISVKDTGIGIPEDKLESIFERFGQVDGSSSRKYEGTGIGLAFAKEIVELHDGTISVKSRQGKGSTFTVTLPLGDECSAALDEEIEDLDEVKPYILADISKEKGSVADTLSGEKKHTILVVDDTPDMVKFIRSLLEGDYRVITADNGRHGFERALSEKPDLVLSDVMMPEMDGYEMTVKIKASEELQGIPVILLTAKAALEMKIEGLAYGADDYLSKPFNAKELRARIQSQLKMKSLRDDIACQSDNLRKEVKRQMKVILGSEILKKYLPSQLVDPILKGETPDIIGKKSERKNLTIFFSDIVGFTTKTDQMQPERLTYLLNDYLSGMTGVVEKHGGTIDKFIGDAIMVYFGAFQSRGDREEAEACVAMAVEMQKSMRELQERWKKEGVERPFEIRCGINTGYSTIGNFGSESRVDYTVIGGEVNLASRLESICEPGSILISHATWALVKDEFACRPKGAVQVKGIHHDVLVYEVETGRVGDKAKE